MGTLPKMFTCKQNIVVYHRYCSYNHTANTGTGQPQCNVTMMQLLRSSAQGSQPVASFINIYHDAMRFDSFYRTFIVGFGLKLLSYID